MSTSQNKSYRWLSLAECMIIAFLPMLGLGIGYTVAPHLDPIVRNMFEGFLRSLVALDMAFYALCALPAFSSHTAPLTLYACVQSLTLGFLLWLFAGLNKPASKLRHLAMMSICVFLSCHALAGLLFYLSHADARHDYATVMTVDHASLLSDCRGLIKAKADTDGASVRISKSSDGTAWSQLPASISNLAWLFVDINQDRVQIQLHGPPRHFVIGFSPEAKDYEYGTIRLAPGLWYWNGINSNTKIGQQSVPPNTHSPSAQGVGGR